MAGAAQAASLDLTGEYFEAPTSVTSLADAETYISGTPTSTFTVGGDDINYTTTATGTLGNFLGADSASLSNPADANDAISKTVLYITGTITIDVSGIYEITIGGDDGYELSSEGDVIASKDGTSSVNYETISMALSAGEYDIALLYYNNFGTADLELSAEYISAVPLPAGLPLLAGGLGSLALLRRRRNKKAAA